MADDKDYDKICCVVDQFCSNPANCDMEDLDKLRTTCYSCGEKVCKQCSTVRSYRKGWRRICHNCSEEIDGNEDERLRHLENLRVSRLKGPMPNVRGGAST
jgi:hypothetical protein